MPPAVKINRKQLTKELVATSKNRELSKKLVRKEVENQLNESRLEFLKNLSDHPVSKEIAAGPSATNRSGTLGGYGNLFSFIGFPVDEKPITFLKSLFYKSKITKVRLTSAQNGRYSIQTNFPSKEEIFEQTPLPWQSDRSWLQGIEQGLSGFQQYFRVNIFYSRSGAALQAKPTDQVKLRGGRHKPTSYFSKLYKDFITSITRRR